MASTFVAINDWCHQLLRCIARDSCLEWQETGQLSCDLRSERLPEDFYSVAACHTLDGLPLEQVRAGCWKIREGCKRAVLQAVGGYEALRMDRRCWFDLRLRPPGEKDSPVLVASELLCFGTGTLRRFSRRLPDGRLHSELEQTSDRIWALGMPTWETTEAATEKQVFDSTNVIYGDVFGQLEQLWQRRAEAGFLDRIAQSLERFRGWRELELFNHAPFNLGAVIGIHLRSQARWRVPPANGRALLRRLDWILENTILDGLATTVRPSNIANPGIV